MKNFVVVHDHVDRPTELLSMRLCVHLESIVYSYVQVGILKSYLFDGNFVSFTPLNADPRIQVVQLARSQGNGLQIVFVFKAGPTSFSENMCVCHLSSLSPCSRACLSFGSRASPSALVAWKMTPLGNLSKIFNGTKQRVKREMSSLLNCLLFLLVITLVASTLSCL